MKKAFELIVIFILIVSAPGCGGKKKGKDLSVSKIKVDIASLKSTVPFTDLVEDHAYIFLETGPDFLVGSMAEIIHRNDCFYILDQSSQQILVFRETGEFLYSIKNQGRGPGEYLYISSFDVTNSGEVLVFDGMSPKLLIYREGTAIPEEHRMQQYFFEMAAEVEDGKLLIRNHVREGKLLNSFAYYNYKTGEVTPAVVQSHPEIDEFFNLRHLGASHIFRSGEALLFHSRFTGRVYESRGEELSLLMSVIGEFPSTEMLAGTLRSGDINMPEGIINELYDIFRTENFVHFRFRNGFFPQTVVVSMDTGKSVRINDAYRSGQEVSGFFGDNRVLGVMGDRFITTMNITNIYKYDEWKERVADSGLNTETREKLLSLTIDDNPVIITFKVNRNRFIPE